MEEMAMQGNMAEKRKFENDDDKHDIHPSAIQRQSSIHGHTYHQHLALVIMLRTYKMHKEKQSIVYNITLEDATGGKFDDIVLRYNLRNGKNGAIYMQCKH
uniref:Uncharacterized protein n=1 Tax=Anopheles dirus TaxID=7168 RepID=A0A182NX93_9DIPT